MYTYKRASMMQHELPTRVHRLAINLTDFAILLGGEPQMFTLESEKSV